MEALLVWEVDVPLRRFSFVRNSEVAAGQSECLKCLCRIRDAACNSIWGGGVFVHNEKKEVMIGSNITLCLCSPTLVRAWRVRTSTSHPSHPLLSLTTRWCTWMKSKLVTTLCVTQWTIMACYHFTHKTWTYLKSPCPTCWDRTEHCLPTPFLW